MPNAKANPIAVAANEWIRSSAASNGTPSSHGLAEATAVTVIRIPKPTWANLAALAHHEWLHASAMTAKPNTPNPSLASQAPLTP